VEELSPYILIKISSKIRVCLVLQDWINSFLQMRFALIACLTVSAAFSSVSCQYNEEYNEDLTLSDLPDGKLLAHFEFTTKVTAHTKPNGQSKYMKYT
jgi:hypothetical protein